MSARPCVAAVALAVCVGCGSLTSSTSSTSDSEQPSSTAGPLRLAPVRTERPALRVTSGDGFSSADLAIARRTPGIGRVARLALGRVSAEIAGGLAEVTVAAVDPLEFRHLAPEPTARADFVWRGLLRGDLVLAHEDRDRLGVALGASLGLRSRGGGIAPTVSAVAANGTPNVAGALLSLDRARPLGLARPTTLLASVREGSSAEAVARALRRRLPGAGVEGIAPPAGRAFLRGQAAGTLFGTFRYLGRSDGTIEQDPRWVAANIVVREVPILGRVRCHRLLFPQLIEALREVRALGLADAIDVADYRRTGGCYVPRFMLWDPSKPVSMHAWGLAIDLNVSANPYGGPSRQHPRVVEAFERWGFRWGGRWSPQDPHHFELGALLRR